MGVPQADVGLVVLPPKSWKPDRSMQRTKLKRYNCCTRKPRCIDQSRNTNKACWTTRRYDPNSSSYPSPTTLDCDSAFTSSNGVAFAHPLLIPHLPSSFHPVLVIRRSFSYLAPQTLRVLTCGFSVSAFPIKLLISSEIASDPNFCNSGDIFASKSCGRCPTNNDGL